MEKNDDISFGVTSHYNQYSGFEVIDVCEQLRSPDGTGGFNRGNAFKYLARAGWKDPGNRKKEIEDLRKAMNYVEREIKRLEALVESEEKPTYGITITPVKLSEEKLYNNIRSYLGEPPVIGDPKACPVCGKDLFLLGGVIDWRTCPDDHGHFACNDINTELWTWVATPGVPAKKEFCPICIDDADHICPHCGIALSTSGQCPSGHGRFDFSEFPHPWQDEPVVPPVVSPEKNPNYPWRTKGENNGMVKRCPDCQTFMTTKIDEDKKWWTCPKDDCDYEELI